MSSTWETLLEQVKGEGQALLKEQVRSLVAGARGDSEEFLRRQGEKMDLYLTQLAEGKITKAQFQGYIEDIRDLTAMQARLMSVTARARAQKLVRDIGDIVLDALLSRL